MIPDYRTPNDIITRVPLDTKQVLEGQILSSLQQAILTNLRADIVEEILNLTYNPQNPQDYALRLAELQGQAGIITMQLALSTEANNTLYNTNPTNEGELE